MDPAELALPVLNSLMLGSLVTLMAVGLTLTFAVTRVLNIAHAELVTLGGYTFVLAVNRWEWHVLPAVLLAMALSAVVAMLMDELVYRPMVRRNASFLYTLVASIGVGIVLRHLIFMGADLLSWLNVKANVVVSPVFRLGYAFVTDLLLWVVPIAIVSAALLYVFLNLTRIGTAMRAVADNLALAGASGVRVIRARRAAWLVSGALAGLAGALWAIYSPITPEMGWVTLLRVVAASVLGGLTSIGATIAGGFVVGFGENLGIHFARDWFRAPLEYRSIITFVIIIIVLLVRPQGLAGFSLRLPWQKERTGGDD